MTRYGFVKEVNLTVSEAEKKVRIELQKEGFGVLTKIDMAETFKVKLDKDIRPYIILGACNPPNAFKAVDAEEDIGLLLPCNVIIRENTVGATVLGIIKPTVSMGMVNNADLIPVAIDVEAALERVFNSVK
jgi:uncharacterized protein (DUF302 family)